MWYRSEETGKVIHSSAAHLIDNMYGEGAFENDIQASLLIPIENPNVIDVLRDTRSLNLAALRYRELHHCSVKEAKFQIKKLKADMASFKTGKKGHKKQWKKKSTAVKTVSSENAPDTTGSSAKKQVAGK